MVTVATRITWVVSVDSTFARAHQHVADARKRAVLLVFRLR
ncbi:hypothetical protein [Microbispora sp. ATCC PTA-5024]|nr:hypothetical protein [Microbispora sp. ATCC PTA-5024]ETK34373.1 hypothetical protein MPTA5024_19705 [Microbispora sp. ATCC PTA-5024]